MEKKIKICLNSMVANESNTIIRMLESCYKYIDYWVIQDNGSKDNTKELINDFFKEKGIPGFLYEVEWQYPGWNRDHALQECLKAKHGCDWILRMDADERLHVDDDFDWSILENTSVDSWNITAQAWDTRYFRTWLWNANRPWFFQHDKRHETIHLPEIGEGFQRETLPYGFRHVITNDGQTWQEPMKFLKDALELELDKVVGNTVKEDTYHLFYLAKSYSDCYGNYNVFPFGKCHADEYARRSIYYFERFLNERHSWDESKTAKYFDEMGYYALILIAEAYAFIGNLDESKKYFYGAEQFAPTRNEHLMYLSFMLFNNKMYDELESVLNKMDGKPNPFPQSSFLIEDRAYSNTGTHINEMREKIGKQKSQPIIKLDSIKFEFN